MDKIKFDFFDILGYLIPGTALLFSCWVVADSSVHRLDDLYGFVKKIDANMLLSGVVIAYIVGFTLHFLGSILFHLRNRKTKRKRDAITSDLSKYWALIREHGDKHLGMLDRWQALKALSSNLAAFSLIAVFLCLVKWKCTGHWEWAVFSPLFLTLFFVYSDRARRFNRYLDEDSYAVFEVLKLKEKLPADV